VHSAYANAFEFGPREFAIRLRLWSILLTHFRLSILLLLEYIHYSKACQMA